MPDPVVITRPRAQAEPLAQRLRAAGRGVVVLPLLEISPLEDRTVLAATLARLSEFDMVAFVSPNAIDAAFMHIDQWPAGVAIAVLGEGSRAALARHGISEPNTVIHTPRDPERSDSESLLAALDVASLRGQRVLIVRGEAGRELMADGLRAAGAQVQTVAAYRRSVPALTPALADQLRASLVTPHDWILTSSEALRGLAGLVASMGDPQLVAKMQQAHLIVPHARIAETAKSLGFTRLTLCAAGDEGVIAALQSRAMNDLPTQDNNAAVASAAATSHEPPPTESISAPADVVQLRQTVAIAVLGVLLVLLGWSANSRIQTLKEEMARSLQQGEANNKDTANLAKSVAEQSKELQIKVGVLENRQAEAQSQQLALEQLYQDLSKNRDEWALSEIEQVLSTASQQLQLSGNVQGALIALQNADRSLSRSDKPQFITIRRAIARDMDKLKALPQLDLTGVAVRIDSVIAQIDTLPLLADEKPLAKPAPATPAPRPARNAKVTVPDVSLATKVSDTWNAWSTEMWGDVRDLIRVRKVDTPDALMLSPGEAYFLRENLKLRLLNARVALLSRNESAFRSDIAATQDALARYFDARARSTQAAQNLLRQVAANNLAIEMPTLAESLNAVRNYKAKP